MATNATFHVDVTQVDADAFARLSGDFNPLHVDAGHAARTAYERPVLHGAFSAGLISRLAGMHLPGRDCLLHGMRLRFLAPIKPPAGLVVSGHLAGESGGVGRVEALVADARTGSKYVEASYEFSRHAASASAAPKPPAARRPSKRGTGKKAPVLVTGATGGLGSALLTRLAGRGLGVSRRPKPGLVVVERIEDLAATLGDQPVGDIVHCAWPTPDNESLLELGHPTDAVEHHVAQPLRDMLALSRLLSERGGPDAMLLLVGSTFAEPGRHAYRMPLYTVAKSMIPTLARVLALELAAGGRRAAAVVFDVVDGGMNKAFSPAIRQAHADRTLTGRLPSPDEAAAQIVWMLENRHHLLSGATVMLSGGALP